MGKKRINDGLNKWQRYRLKDLEGYRKIKRELARTPQHRKKRAEYMQEWRKKYPEKVRLISRNYYKNNRDQIKIKQRRYNLKRLYGLTEADYQRMLADQGGVCKYALAKLGIKKDFMLITTMLLEGFAQSSVLVVMEPLAGLKSMRKIF